VPDELPDQVEANPLWQDCLASTGTLVEQGNPFAMQLLRLLSPAGQAFLATVDAVLKKPSNQDVMVELLHALEKHAGGLLLDEYKNSDIEAIVHEVDMLTGAEAVDAIPGELQALLDAWPGGRHCIRAMLILALLGEKVLNPIFSRTDAIGTVMRKKLKPVTEPIHEQIAVLRSA
jgi:hypothetical protein